MDRALRYRDLGNTGLQVSEIGLGTVELGLDYGFKSSPHARKPRREQALRLLHEAIDLGINLLDTARAYGEAEEIIGEALAQHPRPPHLVTKVIVPTLPDGAVDHAKVREQVRSSLHGSLRALQTDRVDIVLVHNATPAVLSEESPWDVLEELRREGAFRFAGASVRDEAAALQALDRPGIRCLQVAFNLIDQTMARVVFGRAHAQGVGVFIRSAFLRGVLTPQMDRLPEQIASLRQVAARALEIVGEPASAIAAAALRYCLSFAEPACTVIGVRSVEELVENLSAAALGGYPAATLERLREVAIDDERLTNPTNWKAFIDG
jgi:aryl-alcohol dehydrogenase-like predicted oxidoreductase